MKDPRYYRFHIALKVDEDRELIEMMRVFGAVRLLRFLWRLSQERLQEVADSFPEVLSYDKDKGGKDNG